MKQRHLHRSLYIALVASLAVGLAATTGWAFYEHDRAEEQAKQRVSLTTNASTDVQAALDEHGITPLNTQNASNSQTTSSDLVFIVEEEKLAHDVYAVLYEKWGARVFGNIVKSEATHEGMVYSVMESRGISDPRQSSVGVFTNPELQKLYNALIAQGNQSVTEAYKVGVAIEEKDIADIDAILQRLPAQDTDVKSVLESLRQGSENHLRAFSR